MTGPRVTLALFAALLIAAPADAGGIFSRKPKLDAARVKALSDTIRADADERKRRAAVAELRDADPRLHPEVIPALVAALQRDPAAAVRVDAADAIGQYKLVFPLAGLALEAAAEGDPSGPVRDAAHQALWEYHLGGYRSAKGADGIAGQTAEPPIAPPASRRPVAVVQAVPQAKAGEPTPAVLPTTAHDPAPPAPPVVVALKPTFPPSGVTAPGLPRFVEPTPVVAPRTVVSAVPPSILNQTEEPPLAAKSR